MNKQKKPVLTINASHPFPLRNRCRHCGSNKLSYYHDYTNPYWYPDPRYARERCTPEMLKGWLYGTHSDKELQALYKKLDMRFDPTHSVAFKRFNPKLYRGWGGVDSQKRHYVSQMVVVVVCDNCQMQSWGLINRSVRTLPENINRKARIDCPQKAYPLEWW